MPNCMLLKSIGRHLNSTPNARNYAMHTAVGQHATETLCSIVVLFLLLILLWFDQNSLISLQMRSIRLFLACENFLCGRVWFWPLLCCLQSSCARVIISHQLCIVCATGTWEITATTTKPCAQCTLQTLCTFLIYHVFEHRRLYCSSRYDNACYQTHLPAECCEIRTQNNRLRSPVSIVCLMVGFSFRFFYPNFVEWNGLCAATLALRTIVCWLKQCRSLARVLIYELQRDVVKLR